MLLALAGLYRLHVAFYKSDIKDCITLDFESERIEGRPDYPPIPVGLAVRYPDGETDYFAWGHPTGNNCDLKSVRSWLRELWREETPLLFFNAKFDLSICYEILDLPKLPALRIHDAMFLAFLVDPHARELGLKEMAEEWLDWPPEEKDAVAEYVWENRKPLVEKYGGKITRAKRGQYSAGAWLSKCPAGVVEPYAIGDVDRTHGLFEHFYPIVAEFGMCDAYDRERKILPIFMENEEDGIHTDLEALERDTPKLQESLFRADALLGDMLGVPGLNINADAQLGDALSSAGVVLDKDWVLTKTGQKSVSKENLTYEMFQNEEIGHLYFYRNKLTTALSTFMEPWLRQAQKRDGIISTNWNQVRGSNGGARTGRPSTNNPNFLNIPREFDQEYNMPEGNKHGLYPLPFVRYYILPDPGHLFIHRDFDGQEMRIFAHYEDGELLQAYQDDPETDPHIFVGKIIGELTGKPYDDDVDRKPTKTLNFLGLYGGGAPAAAKKLGVSLAEAKRYKLLHDQALPGRLELNRTIQEMVRAGEPIKTWGGRIYYPEDPKIVNGRWQNFEYKLINYLCQGSAADVTKEAMIRWYEHPKREARFLVQVYDEMNISAYEDIASEQMAVLKECMDSIELDLEMRSSGKIGERWGILEKYDD